MIGKDVHEVFEYNVSNGTMDNTSEDDFDIMPSFGEPKMKPAPVKTSTPRKKRTKRNKRNTK